MSGTSWTRTKNSVLKKNGIRRIRKLRRKTSGGSIKEKRKSSHRIKFSSTILYFPKLLFQSHHLLGKGFTEEGLLKANQQFYRENQSRHLSGYYGIALYFTKNVLAVHGGMVSVFVNSFASARSGPLSMGRAASSRTAARQPENNFLQTLGPDPKMLVHSLFM